MHSAYLLFSWQWWIFRFLVTRSLCSVAGLRRAVSYQKKIPAQRGDSFIYMQVHDVPPEPENGYDLCIRRHFLSHIHQYDESIHQAMKY